MNIWLSNYIGTSAANIITSLVFLIIIIAAIVVVITLLRYLNKRGFNFNRKQHPLRLIISDTIAIDRTRRLVLIRRDDVEHLILIGGTTDTIIESNIVKTQTSYENYNRAQKDIQPTSKMAETNFNTDFTEQTSLSSSTIKPTQDNISSPSCENKQLKDSALTAEIEERQEPSFFIPTPK
ncbi:flagellar biosynthetic protein FliO [Bartonella sp. WD12.1]|uniref:flagellar biosynthetic protein FliO n=1 Tax=Bartonella sp. WD12.1 TaxID=1933903 RepID=UPI0009995C8A|nr:flagellar biosynthetic protein FliO [Bartonella sp. WD12.1]OPB29700.1 Flagellar biosynthesis protein, FliO [Bartonella sp. WD12.1]